MSAITAVTSMPADSASPSGMLTTALPKVRLQASASGGGVKLTVIQKNEGGKWFRTKAVLDLVGGETGEVFHDNPFGSNAYHVLYERGGYVGSEAGTATCYIAGATAPVTAGDLTVSNVAAGGTLAATGAATLGSTLAVTGATTLTGQLNANGGEKLAGSSPSAAADAVGLGVADVNGATTAGLVKTFEGGGVEQERVMSTSATIKRMTWSESVADDATLTLPLPTNLGIAVVTTYDESLTVTVKSDGTCAKMSGTTNTDVADTDAKLDVYNNTTDVKVKNRLGGSRHVRVEYTAS